jgi:4-aminobutyrate aminotransferase-like enzyme
MLYTLRPPTHRLDVLQDIARMAYEISGEWKPLEGERDQNFRLTEAGGAAWVIKVCNPRENPEIIRCQTGVLEHVALTDPALPVPRPRRSLTGDATPLVEIDGGTYHLILLSYLPDSVIGDRELGPQQYREIGRIVARLGWAMRGFVSAAPAGRRLIWDNCRVLALRPYVPRLAAGLQAIATRLLDHFARSMESRLATLRSQIIHGDVHPFNMLVEGSSISGIIDVGDIVHASLVQDAANCVADFLMPGRAIEPIVSEFIRGYCSVTPLEEDELDIVLDVMEIRLLMTPLIEAAKQSEGLPVQGYLEAFGTRCLPLLEETTGPQRKLLVDAIRRAGSYPPRKADDAGSVDSLLARRTRLMGTKSVLFYDPSLHVVRGEGVWLYVDKGRRYLDCYNNVPHVGHCHPYVVNAISRQAALLNTNTRYITEQALEYAERLTATMDESLPVVVFVNSGSEANDVAWCMAKARRGHRGSLAMDFAYHGITEAIDAFSPSNTPGTWNEAQIRLLPPPDGYRGPILNGDSELAAKYATLAEAPIAELRREGLGLAAAMIDGAFMTSGMLNVPRGYMQRIIEMTHRAGGLYIADEVQAGFGRMGTAMWGHQHHGIVPDFVTIGKPAGNGHPIGVVVTRPEILEKFSKCSPFFSTFGGNNVSCAAGIAVLDVVRDEGLIENARVTGEYLRSGLHKLMTKHELIGDVRGVGLAVGIELVRDCRSKEPAASVVNPLLNFARDDGVLMGSEGKLGNIIRIRPPIVFKREHADIAIAALDHALGRL